MDSIDQQISYLEDFLNKYGRTAYTVQHQKQLDEMYRQKEMLYSRMIPSFNVSFSGIIDSVMITGNDIVVPEKQTYSFILSLGKIENFDNNVAICCRHAMDKIMKQVDIKINNFNN